MNRYVHITLLAGMAASSAAGNDVVFHKSRTFDNHGKEHKVDLVFLGDYKAMVVREKTTIIANIPFGAIDKVAYGYAKNHRIGEGGTIMSAGCCPGLASIVTLPAGVLVGGGVMLTKEKKHWLYVDYKDAGGAKESVLMLDKSEYQKVITAIRAQTGRDVEILPEEGKEKK